MLKHYRKQYGNTNNKQTYNRSNMVNAFERPGGTIMKSYAYDNCTSNNFNGSVLVPDYAIKEANQFIMELSQKRAFWLEVTELLS